LPQNLLQRCGTEDLIKGSSPGFLLNFSGDYGTVIVIVLWWDDLACGPCELKSALAVGAFGNFIETYTTHGGLPISN
jgi:hypothetical protein